MTRSRPTPTVRGLSVGVLDPPGIRSSGFEEDSDDLGRLGDVEARVALAVGCCCGAGGGGEGLNRVHHLQRREGGRK